MARKDLSADLWQAILAAWHDKSCAVDDWDGVLDALTFVLRRSDLSRGIAWVLVRFAKEAEVSELYERANRLASDMWRENSDDAEGWLGSGLAYASCNSAAGQVPMYWVEFAKHVVNGGIVSERLAAELKSEVSEIVRSKSQQSTVSKFVLGAWFHVLHRIDTDWANEVLLPMFGDKHAGFAAAWEGFLWTFPSTMWIPDEMLPYVDVPITNRHMINTEHDVSVARYVARLCCDRDAELAHRLVRTLYNTAEAARRPEDIVNFVSNIRFWLKWMDVEQRAHLWDSWLEEYLSRRWMGLPSGLVRGEVWELLTLIPVLLPAVPEVVEVLTDFPLDQSATNSFDMIFHRVDVDDFPREYTKLMLYLDRYELGSWQWDDNKKHIDKLIANEAVPLDQRKRLQDLKFKYMID